jgi:hypothetical protein
MITPSAPPLPACTAGPPESNGMTRASIRLLRAVIGQQHAVHEPRGHHVLPGRVDDDRCSCRAEGVDGHAATVADSDVHQRTAADEEAELSSSRAL